MVKPKTTTPDTCDNSTTALVAQIQELTRTIAGFSARFDKLEGIMADLRHENKLLKDTLEDRDKELLNMKERHNDLEQHGRGWSMRVLGMQIPSNEANDPLKVMQHIFDRALLPIFQGAIERHLIQTMPKVSEILETAHILPSKPDTINPIIARFYSRNIRAMVFRLKKEFAPRQQPEGRSRSDAQRPGKFLFPIYEDLTRPTFHKMRALASHEDIEACWTVNGKIKFKVKNSTEIRRVKSVFMSVDDIIS